eukprot:CAMPEP_0197630840 /NCGR_PEP_ID=MMETSP1338-20131121/8198_1 /TAXON_ID=43686 ORGANISM="Pelagodinium beii, Strain RCC1491" /NCGR_SAMPLE_ID=MMETSP1338 /ASSEMBLY_ACC=CAM_ASM_000754 /LENGTH=334 /DNA_ID=CAMNT_0043202153 /DNA_START=144 /DNA_END=1145 /DNA_ORIENTATION=+
MKDAITLYLRQLTTWAFIGSVILASLSGILASALYLSGGNNYMKKWVPDQVVFNVLVTFSSLVATFRTAHALRNFVDAGSYLHKLSASWFDATSSLIAFCRHSEQPAEQIDQFIQTLVRLVSLMNALSLDSLQGTGNGIGDKYIHHFELLSPEELDSDTQDRVLESQSKVEYAFQMTQQLVVDAIQAKIIMIPAPIVVVSFQDLAAALQTYHEAKKVAAVKLPVSYIFVTLIIQITIGTITPCFIVTYVQGATSAFMYSFGGVFLLGFLNAVADSLHNPFYKGSRTLDAESVQRELNHQLEQLLQQARQDSPKYVSQEVRVSKSVSNRSTFRNW